MSFLIALDAQGMMVMAMCTRIAVRVDLANDHYGLKAYPSRG
jgi:hypothetical protein